MGVLDTLVFVSVLLLSLAVSILITVPLNGALVRLRANYNPKGLQLDPEGNVEPHTGPIVTSFFGMLRRVKRLEGWAGLYKGLMPTLLATSFLTIFVVLALDAANPSYLGRVDPPTISPLETLLYGLFYLVISLPATIIATRAITTPYKLPYLNPIKSLRVLLTPTERRRPWILYATPGLFVTETLHIAYLALVLGTLRIWLVPAPGEGQSRFETFSPIKFSIYLTIQILSTAILCPLEVMATKLAIQRNHAAPEYNSVEQEVEDATADYADLEEYSGDEEVIGLRSEKDPYLGFANCFKRIVDEEGWKTLYRAWWVTMLGGVFQALGSAAQAQAP
ncbi:mitochondrial carrier [Obba rivulosa]|uniref:Mitochondrial carrier n=1 Tax=Obba rivulosa TaxID=1052685 RepID=A0A8E2DMK4_9APHY|nr:mitochondrial carrier [Obba rivulosa]